VLHTLSSIQVTPEDLLPVALCTSCVYKLEMCHEFVHGCLDADIKLRTILGLQVDHKVSAYSKVQLYFDLILYDNRNNPNARSQLIQWIMQ
jgi:hypothetical protein